MCFKVSKRSSIFLCVAWPTFRGVSERTGTDIIFGIPLVAASWTVWTGCVWGCDCMRGTVEGDDVPSLDEGMVIVAARGDVRKDGGFGRGVW